MTSAEARFNNSLRPRKPEGSLGRTAQDGHLDSHTAPELCVRRKLQALVYDILPPTTAIVDYGMGLEKLSADEQFFDDAQTAVNL